MRQRTWTSALAAIGIGGALALAGPALPAVSLSSPPSSSNVEITDNARLVARGAAVKVTVRASCLSLNPNSEVSVSVTQARGRLVASGFGSATVPCDGATHRVPVIVTSENLTFKTGSAVARAQQFVCQPFFGCEDDSDTEVIRIRS